MDANDTTRVIAALNKIAEKLNSIGLTLESIDQKLGKEEKKPKGTHKGRVLSTEDDD